MINPIKLYLKPEDSAPAPTVVQPPADLDALNAKLSATLTAAGGHLVNLLLDLNHVDIFEARRLARMWGEEAHTQLVTAMETREALSKGMRDQQITSAIYGTASERGG